jgi:hypothetical protein
MGRVARDGNIDVWVNPLESRYEEAHVHIGQPRNWDFRVSLRTGEPMDPPPSNSATKKRAMSLFRDNYSACWTEWHRLHDWE